MYKYQEGSWTGLDDKKKTGYEVIHDDPNANEIYITSTTVVKDEKRTDIYVQGDWEKRK